MTALSCMLVVTEQDGRSYQRGRLMVPFNAGLAAALAVAAGAQKVEIWPDSPADALIEARLSGDVF